MSADHSAEDIDHHVKIYLRVFAALFVLTIVTVLVSYLDVSVGIGVAIALFIASIKGFLVAGYFMHLMSEKKLIYSVLGITVVFFFAMLFGPVVTQSDSIGEEQHVSESVSHSVHHSE